MTVTYSYDLSTAKYWPKIRVILRWRGGVWKSVFVETVLWLILYAALSCFYRFGLNEEQEKTFEKVVSYCYKFGELIPLTFMLGFYVTNVASRWWNVILHIGFTDNLVMVVQNYIRGIDERSLMIKRSIARYMCLVQVLMYRACSLHVNKAFPDKQSLMKAGYINQTESEMLMEEVFWMPVNWALALARRARDEGRLSEHGLRHITEACKAFYEDQLVLSVYNWIPVPLAYTQVVFITVRCYFLVAVVGRQYINNSEMYPIDIYVPFQTVLQIIFYLGWLKVAEAMLNPFGDDDDDFDGVWWLQRNLSKTLDQITESDILSPAEYKLKMLQDSKQEKTGDVIDPASQCVNGL